MTRPGKDPRCGRMIPQARGPRNARAKIKARCVAMTLHRLNTQGHLNGLPLQARTRIFMPALRDSCEHNAQSPDGRTRSKFRPPIDGELHRPQALSKLRDSANRGLRQHNR